MADENEDLTSEEEETEELEETEETKELTEAELAEKALKATDEAADEQKVPVATLAKMRRRAQAAELEAARLQGQLETTAKPEEKPTAKEPLDELEEGESLSREDYLKQRAYEKQQQEQKELKAEGQKRIATAKTSYVKALVELTEEKVGEGLDLQTVLTQGEANLTAGDKLDIAEGGEKSLQIAYERCIQRTPELSDKRAAHNKAKATKKKGKEKETKEKEKDKGESEERKPSETAHSRVVDFIFSKEE